MGLHHKVRIGSLALLMGAGVIVATAPSFAQTNEQDRISDVDRTFFKDAARADVQEIRESRAQQNSRNSSVRMFAHRMMQDHLANYGQIAALAKTYGITVPAENSIDETVPENENGTGTPPPNAQNMRTHMAPMMSDRAFMAKEVADHQKALDMFNNEAKNGGTGALRSLAKVSASVVQTHLTMAQQYMRTGHITPIPNPTNPPYGTPG